MKETVFFDNSKKFLRDLIIMFSQTFLKIALKMFYSGKVSKQAFFYSSPD